MQQQKDILFGTDGWRGVLDAELNVQNVERVAQAFSDYITEGVTHTPQIAVGYDGRYRSKDFAVAFSGVLAGNGIRVLLASTIVPTPVVAYHTVYQRCDAGVMVTASHNPPQYNGIKFKSPAGAPLITSETKRIEAFLDEHQPRRLPGEVDEVDFLTDYKTRLGQLIDFSAIYRSGMKMAIDSMAGAGGHLLSELCSAHHIPASGIYQQPAPDFAGRQAEPIEKNLQPLARFLKNGDFTLGVATDGDADRLGVMTEQGQWMNVQETILYLAQYVKTQRRLPGGLVKTLSVTDKMIALAKQQQVAFRDVQVGFKYVAESMMDIQAAFGAEESGGFGFGDHLPERDGIFSALLFAEMLANSGHSSLSDFIEAKRKEWGPVYYDRVDMQYTGQDRFQLLQNLYHVPPVQIGDFPVKELLHHCTSRGVINSLKFYLEGEPRWLLIRISETEPVVRIYAEGRSFAEVKQLLDEGRQLIQMPGKGDG